MRIPNYQLIADALKRYNPDFDTATEIKISKELFLFLLQRALPGFDFDQTYYLERHDDVRQALRDGKIKSARTHYLETGYFERREAMRSIVDENWYSQRNPDVDEGVKSGRTRSATAHYRDKGWSEWRAPNKEAEAELAFWKKLLMVK